MGDAATCFHPIDDKIGEAGFCFHPMDDDKGGEAGFCFHPEHEADLSLHGSLTAIDALELEQCR
jgi:hypothetical protein